MTSFDDSSQYTPSVIKSCSRCRARKVKCDLKVPQCSACQKHSEACNITEYVAYPYSLVASLHSRVKELEQKLQSYSNQTGSISSSDLLGGAPTQLDNSERPVWSVDVSKEAEEVGVLAIGYGDRYSEKKYVGAAAGSTFARIFFKQVGLSPSSEAMFGRFEHKNDALVSTASVPTKMISTHLLYIFIARVHLWWPFLDLRHVRGCFRRVYQEPRASQDFERFIFFIILALASDQARRDQQYTSLLDLNTPQEYFQSALHYFGRFQDHPRGLPGLQAVLLLTLWMLNSASCNHGNDLWHLTRYAMSIALELGVHRHNPSWNFSPEELELRSRTWWSVYSLERFIALSSGRVLSVRDQAIDTPLPSPSNLDQLTGHEAKFAPLFNSKPVLVFTQAIELRQIAGRILESIYIARDQHGRCSSLNFQDLCSISDELHRQLDKWKIRLDSADIPSHREFRMLKIEYYSLLLHLNRPSPAFMIPSQHMIAVCSHASSNALHQLAALAAEDGIDAVCRCYRHFHDILMIGLARLYCDWHTQKITPTSTASALRPEDSAICYDLLSKGIKVLAHPPLSKFLTLFSALRSKIYSPRASSTGPIDFPITQTHPRGELFANPSDMMEDGDQGRNDENLDSMALTGSDELEAYLNQVSTIFDNELFSLDDSLTAWYESVLDDIGSNDNNRRHGF
ncbi:fungal-specific transcription factor domain-containing protein [Aspergillus carlsbadensis]|nr:fungal-specific transcription factor domain-containing protein [Aspergillus carlsbadensis]